MRYMIIEHNSKQEIKRFNVPNFKKYSSLGYRVFDINMSKFEAELLLSQIVASHV
jgi:hypothetical protein